jgi:alanyl-tRNA synthetase
MALFGEKYGDTVRVVSIAPFSLELCGGCHVKHTGQIGPFVITQESSIASGVRRIEALTGPKAVHYIQNSRKLLRDLDQLLNSPAEGLTQRVKDMINQVRSLEKELQQVKAQQVLRGADEFLQKAEKVGDISLVIREFEDVNLELLKQLGDTLRHKSSRLVGFLVNHADSGQVVNFVCAVTDDLIREKKLNAGELVRQAAQIAGGGGGGRPHLATAGAKSADKLGDVFDFIRQQVKGISN